MKEETKTMRTSGSGGAHLGWSMFGARGPLLAPEPEGGGGGDPKPPGQGGDPALPKPTIEPKPGGEGDKLFTQADLDRHIQERIDRDRRSRGTPTPPADTKKKSSKAENSDDSTTWVFDFTDSYDAITEERGIKPSRGLKSRMRTAFGAERPTDPDAWIAGWLDDAGLVKKSDTPNPQQQQAKGGEAIVPEKKTGDGPPNSDKGGAGGVPLDFEAKLTERPLELTKLDIQRLVVKHGEEKANVMIRDAVNAKLSNMKLKADPKRADR